MREQGIVLFHDNFQHVRYVLSFEQKGVLMDAIFDGEYSGDDPLVQMAFNLFQAGILRSAEKYEATCAKNRENALRKWQRNKENEEKAAAYDRLQSDASASNCKLANATGAGAGTGAGIDDFLTKKCVIPPHVDEVRAYCLERGNRVDPEQFVDFYDARGWQLKRGVLMRDWKAAVRTWERNSVEGTKNGAFGKHCEEDRIPGQRDQYEAV